MSLSLTCFHGTMYTVTYESERANEVIDSRNYALHGTYGSVSIRLT